MFNYICFYLNKMNLFSISQLAQFSGIKAHTIRMWEQRYNALRPKRSSGNTRSYDGTQLRRLLNIVSLCDSGYKVSELCVMTDKKLFGLLEEFSREPSAEPGSYFISQLISAGISYDEVAFEKIFSHSVLRYGLKETYLKTLYPAMVRMGLMWSNDTIAPTHEHFISNLIRQKLCTSIDSLPPSKSGSDSWLLFLPENEFHETGLLFAHYLIRSTGRKVIYLGSNLPFESLQTAAQNISPGNLLLFFVHNDFPEAAREYLSKLSNGVKSVNIFAAGHQNFTEQLGKIKKVRFLNSVGDLVQELP